MCASEFSPPLRGRSGNRGQPAGRSLTSKTSPDTRQPHELGPRGAVTGSRHRRNRLLPRSASAHSVLPLPAGPTTPVTDTCSSHFRLSSCDSEQISRHTCEVPLARESRLEASASRGAGSPSFAFPSAGVDGRHSSWDAEQTAQKQITSLARHTCPRAKYALVLLNQAKNHGPKKSDSFQVARLCQEH